MGRLRFTEVGIAALLAVAGVTGFGVATNVGAAGSPASSFVPIVPCRLADTRPAGDNVGVRATPLAAGETATFAVWGTNGNCTIPTTATGIASNMTIANPTASSFLTVFPADAVSKPLSANLTWVANGAPTPNQVTVALSAAGR